MIPGEYILKKDDIECNVGKKTIKLSVTNSDDRPIAIGSHIHFFEINKFIKFDREKAYGYRLDIPSGTSVRFEGGETKEVCLVELGGQKIVYGINNLTNGNISDYNLKKSLNEAKLYGFID